MCFCFLTLTNIFFIPKLLKILHFFVLIFILKQLGKGSLKILGMKMNFLKFWNKKLIYVNFKDKQYFRGKKSIFWNKSVNYYFGL